MTKHLYLVLSVDAPKISELVCILRDGSTLINTPNNLIVDGPILDSLITVLDLTVTLLLKFGAVVLYSPVFSIPGIFIGIIGGYLGQIYMKAQLSVKREMSNARSPVIGHFGAAIAGLGEP